MNTDVTITITNEVAEAVCRGAGYLELKPEYGAWTNPETAEVYNNTHEALLQALPAIAEQIDISPADLKTIHEADEGLSEAPERTQTAPDGTRFEASDDTDQELRDALDEAPPLGTRVEFTRPVERYPHFLVPAGATGVVTRDGTDHHLYSVKLDDRLAGAEDWDNEVIWVLDTGSNPADDIARDYVNRTAIKAMTDQELRDEIFAGGPAEADQAMREELGKREIAQADQEIEAYAEAHRQADSIYSDEWDANGTISVYLPAVNFRPWLEARGWKFTTNGRWLSPRGVYYWNIAEALQRQILAETIQTGGTE
jgi:hypothetical protein